MFKIKFAKSIAVLALFGGILFSTSCKDKVEPEPEPTPLKSIAAIAAADTSFSILVACLTKAELVNTLSNSGTFTVFAPTNAAFRASGLANAASLTKEALTPILLYHVLGSTVKSTDLAAKQYVSTLSDGPKSATNKDTKVSLLVRKGSTVTLNGTKATVIVADIPASNGIIHAIDKVITPVTLADLATNDTDFSSLLAAVSKAQLATALADLSAKYTVFAPVNSAFTGIDLNALTEAQAAEIVSTHVINTLNVLASEVSGFTAAPVTSLNPLEQIVLKITSGSVFVSSDNTMDSKVIAADVQAVNGIIHGVDKVLLP